MVSGRSVNKKSCFYFGGWEFLFNFASGNPNDTIMSTQAMQKTIAEYFKTQPVLKAWLFGSYARGEERDLK